MRKLMWFTLGFAASCAMFAYVLLDAWLLPSVYISLAACVLLLLAALKWKQLHFLSLAGIGCSIGFIWCMLFQQNYLAPVQILDGKEVFASVTLTDYSYETDYGIGADGRVALWEKSWPVRIYLDPMEQLSPGDSVEGTLLFRSTTPDGSKESSYHQGEGVFLLAYQHKEVTVTRQPQLPAWSAAPQLRKNIQNILGNCFSLEIGAFAKALLLGDTTGLNYETDTAFKLSGIRHVVAVSGLHVSILFALLSLVTFRKRYFMAILGLPLLLLFAAVAGFTPSVVRSCIMCALMLLASLFNREYDGPTALAFAVLVMLAVNPLAIVSVGLQLSVASIAGIFLFQQKIQKWFLTRFRKDKKRGIRSRIRHWIVSSVSVTLSATILTTPLCAYYFGTVSLIGPFTNLLTLWIISFIFYGLMAICVLYPVWQAAAVILARVISVPIRYVLSCAKLLGALPVAAIYTNSSYIVLWLILCGVLLGVFLLQRNKKPELLLSCIAISLCLALLASWMDPMQDDFRMTVLDVGQGQAIILQSEGRTFLVDCGGDSETKTADIIAGTLLSQGIDHLDGIILTHFDLDHCGAMEELLTRIQTDLLLVPDTVDAKSFSQVEGTVCYVNEDINLVFGGSCIRVFGPIYSGADNENSLCILFESENCAILITGDRSDFGERMLLRQTDLPDVDVLIAGHHGAKSSTSPELLQAVTPETVIISVGEGNYYGHPHDDLIQRLLDFGCTVYRTDLYGTILYRR